MGAAYWIKSYLLAALPLFAILAAVEWYKGELTSQDMLSAGAWALIAAAMFTVSRYRRYRLNQIHGTNNSCALCSDITKPRDAAKAVKPNEPA